MDDTLSRRKVIHLAMASAAVAVLSACSGSGPEAFGDVSAGNVSALTLGQIKLIAGSPVVVGLDSGGVYSMTTTCTHAGCDMANDVGPTALICTCHGSRFDVNGSVLQGPAHTALEHFAVSLDASGNITVHGAEVVDASVRVKPA